MGRKGPKGSRPNPHLNQNVSINVTHSSIDSIPYREDQADITVKALNLALFKTKKCPIKEEVRRDHSAQPQAVFLLPQQPRQKAAWQLFFERSLPTSEQSTASSLDWLLPRRRKLPDGTQQSGRAVPPR